WSYYFDYVFLFQGGVGSLPVPIVGYWWIILGILYFSFFTVLALWFRAKKTSTPDLNAVAFLTFYGILQFLYFFFRAHPNNLWHISMPSALLVLYWLYTLRTRNIGFLPGYFQKGIFGAIVI